MVGKFYHYLKKTAKAAGATLGVAATLALGTLYVSDLDKPPLEVHNTQKQKLGPTINVMTANVAGGRGRNTIWPIDFLPAYPFLFNEISNAGLRALDDVIIEEGTDVACMQEIEKSGARVRGEGIQDQPREFSENTQLKNYVFDSNVTSNFLGKYHIGNGNAIFSRVPISDSTRAEFNQSFGFSDVIESITGIKGILHTKVHYEDLPINIICTHLSNLEMTVSGEEREQELAALFQYTAEVVKSTKAPAIVIGDLNTLPEDKAWGLVRSIRNVYNLEIYCGLDKLAQSGFPRLRKGSWLGSLTPDELGKKSTRKDQGKFIDYICVVNHPDNQLLLDITSMEPHHKTNVSDHAIVNAKVKGYKK